MVVLASSFLFITVSTYDFVQEKQAAKRQMKTSKKKGYPRMKMKFFLVMFAILGRGLCDIADGDKNALLALYSSTKGEGWNNNDKWSFDEVRCDSYGVECNSDGRVTKLDLSDNYLDGKIPSKLVGLTALTKLYLSGNNFTCPVLDYSSSVDTHDYTKTLRECKEE
eukprot:936495_1